MAALGLLLGCSGEALSEREQVGSTQEALQWLWVDLNNQSGLWYTHLLTTLSSNIFATMIAPQSAGGGNCGLTYISKHYAITAAHCVNANASSAFAIPNGQFTVKQIMTTNLDPFFALIQASSTSGTFPNWTTMQLDSSHGYIVTPTTCTVKWRCDSQYGPRVCPPLDPPNFKEVDIALIHCPNRTATSYVQVNAGNPAVGSAISTLWFHEILALERWQDDLFFNFPADNWENYGKYQAGAPGAKQNNWHYRGSDQIIYYPLASFNWADGTNYTMASSEPSLDSNGDASPRKGTQKYTDMPYCHGQSGSGRFINGTSTLLGPSAIGGGAGEGRLCINVETAAKNDAHSTFVLPQWTRALEQFPGVVGPDR